MRGQCLLRTVGHRHPDSSLRNARRYHALPQVVPGPSARAELRKENVEQRPNKVLLIGAAGRSRSTTQRLGEGEGNRVQPSTEGIDETDELVGASQRLEPLFKPIHGGKPSWKKASTCVHAAETNQLFGGPIRAGWFSSL